MTSCRPAIRAGLCGGIRRPSSCRPPLPGAVGLVTAEAGAARCGPVRVPTTPGSVFTCRRYETTGSSTLCCHTQVSDRLPPGRAAPGVRPQIWLRGVTTLPQPAGQPVAAVLASTSQRRPIADLEGRVMNVEITGLTRRSGRTAAVAGVDLRAGLRPVTRPARGRPDNPILRSTSGRE